VPKPADKWNKKLKYWREWSIKPAATRPRWIVKSMISKPPSGNGETRQKPWRAIKSFSKDLPWKQNAKINYLRPQYKGCSLPAWAEYALNVPLRSHSRSNCKRRWTRTPFS
jgi:hypothetical protein